MVGDTLKYDIHIDGHANHGDTRIFFFHYDCRVAGDIRLSVREGQAGFFTDEELAESGGILWQAETGEWNPQSRFDKPAQLSDNRAFSNQQLEEFAEGNGQQSQYVRRKTRRYDA